MAELRKYGVQTTILFPLIDAGAVDFEATPVTDSGTDCEIIKDEGTSTTATNDFAHEGRGIYSLVLTATEMQAARIVVTIVDDATKAFEDQCVIIDTYGHASAQHAVDLDDGVRAGLTALPNAAADAAGGLPISDAGGLDLDAMNTNINDIETDTNALQIDLADGGRLDLLIDAIKAVTDNLPNSGALTDLATAASITALNDISTADVNAQVSDVLKTDTVTEMSQGAPPASPTMQQILNYLYRELVRNKIVVDTNVLNQKQIFADDGSTVLYEKDLTNASNVTTVAEATTGA
jgi:hypothetical protein